MNEIIPYIDNQLREEIKKDPYAKEYRIKPYHVVFNHDWHIILEVEKYCDSKNIKLRIEKNCMEECIFIFALPANLN